jgi:hypothetical protein
MKTFPYHFAAGFLLVGSAVTVLAQGSLTPPGPPAPAMKSLDQIGADIAHVNATATGIAAKAEKRIPIDAAHTRGGGTNPSGTSDPWANLAY